MGVFCNRFNILHFITQLDCPPHLPDLQGPHNLPIHHVTKGIRKEKETVIINSKATEAIVIRIKKQININRTTDKSKTNKASQIRVIKVIITLTIIQSKDIINPNKVT